MQIFVRGTANVLAVNVTSDDTAQDIYEYVAEQSACNMNSLFLSFHGTPLFAEQTLDTLDLVPGAVIDASIKVLGGKTHGGLMHAGRVKKITPKVPPQEKSKKKTGRARRREQYAQRFSNNVALPSQPGRGPNSNY